MTRSKEMSCRINAGGDTMKPHKTLISIIIFCTFCLIPQIVMANQVIGSWVAELWQPQDMISWGNDCVLVDFGSNGLWKYDGSWIRMSHWDPKHMITWGEAKLIVDFGQHGLYNYNGKFWDKISVPSQ